MHAIQITSHGPVAVLRPAELARPAAAPDGVLVKTEYAGVNYLDVQVREGLFGIPTPFTGGFEGAGTIIEVGSEVADLEPGQRVVWSNVLGSYAEYVAVPATHAVPIPDGLSSAVAAAVQVQGITAQYLSTDAYAVRAGDTIAVHAAAGGVGQLLTQFAKDRGARVIATASSPAKADAARRLGADEAVAYGDLVARAHALTGGAGLDAVFDGVGVATYEESVRALGVRGTLVLYGEASGVVPPFDPAEFGGRSVTLVRPSFGDYTRTREEIRARSAAVHEALLEGRLTVDVDADRTLDDAAEAQALLEERRSTGKIVLRVS
ncbi:quinone oxidoreductase family protein [Microbacterium tumbae]